MIIITKTLAPNCINAVDYNYTWISFFRADSDHHRALIAMHLWPQGFLMVQYIPVLLFALLDIYSGLMIKREWVLHTGLCKVTMHSLTVTLAGVVSWLHVYWLACIIDSYY